MKQLKLPFVPDRGKQLHRQGSMERVLASAKANVPRVKKSQPKLEQARSSEIYDIEHSPCRLIR